jgi:SAM-dependent methyltransferase
MPDTHDPDAIRRAVARTYADAVGAGQTAGTELAGYTAEQVGALPDGVTASFFGCGNPLSLASVEPGQTVLDLGSGAGLDLILAGQAVGPGGRVIGVDMTEVMIERARANVARAGLDNVEIRAGLIEQLPVADASVDLVISNCVISLSPDKDKTFSEIARVLRPGGEMVISDIVVDRPLAFVLARLVGVAPSIAMATTEDRYLAAMRRAGLTAPRVVDRLIYEPDDLIGLFAPDVTPASATEGTCPITSIGDRVRSSRPARTAIRIGARAVAGHVWSAKFRARRA